MRAKLYGKFTLVEYYLFDAWSFVGSSIELIKVYQLRRVDKLIFLKISATLQSREPDFELIDDLADECILP